MAWECHGVVLRWGLIHVTYHDMVLCSGGALTKCQISPDLHVNTGLTFSSLNCEISGTPSLLASALVSYTVTGENYGGVNADGSTKMQTTSTKIQVQVNAVPPSALHFKTTTFEYIVDTTSTFNFPAPTASGGAITKYQISPSLPSGLSITSYGNVSGTPSVVSATNTYTVTGSNSGGTCTATLVLTVLAEAPSGLSYGGDDNKFTENYPAALTPHYDATTTAGGAKLHFTVTPPLMTGVTLDPDTGKISGTPVALLWPAHPYIVTVNSTGGSDNTTVNIAVIAVKPTNLQYPTKQLSAGYPLYVTGSGGDDSYSWQYTLDQTVQTDEVLMPTYDGGRLNACAINPLLPTGLIFNGATCAISGTPSVLSPSLVSYTVTASNHGNPTTETTISINVYAQAPYSMTYSPAQFTFVFNETYGSTFPTPQAKGGTVTKYSISGTLSKGLTFDTQSGVISGKAMSIQESYTNHTVTASNTGGTTTCVIAIRVVPEAPKCLSYDSADCGGAASYTLILSQSFTAKPSLNYEQATAGNASLSFGLLTGTSSLPTGLALNPNTGVIDGIPSSLLLSSGTPTWPAQVYTVTVSNGGVSSSQAKVSIAVVDKPISSLTYPSSGYTTPLYPAYALSSDQLGTYTYIRGAAPAAVLPANHDGGTITTCSISPNLYTNTGLTFNTKDCSIGISSDQPILASKLVKYTVKANNLGNTGVDTTMYINVVAVAPSGLSYPNGASVSWTVGNSSSFPTPVVGGDPVVAWSIVPTVPAGLTFDTTTGTISGTPSTITAKASYTVTASNTGGSTTASISLAVLAVAPEGLSYDNVASPASAIYTVYVDSSFTASPTISSGFTKDNGTVTYSISPTSFQADTGLSISQSTGVVQGTTSSTVMCTAVKYTVSATNTGGTDSAYVTFSLIYKQPTNVAYPTTTLTSTSSYPTYKSSGENNVYTYTLAVATTNALAPSVSSTGGPITGCSITPHLPSGLLMSTTTCGISGKPTVEAISKLYYVTYWNCGNTKNDPIPIYIEVLAKKPTSLSYSQSSFSYLIGAPVSGFPTPTAGGDPIVSFSASPSLPAGLSLNSTGSIIGTPTVVTASTTYTITASNSGGTSLANITLQVQPYPPCGLSYGSAKTISKQAFTLNQVPTPDPDPNRDNASHTQC